MMIHNSLSSTSNHGLIESSSISTPSVFPIAVFLFKPARKFSIHCYATCVEGVTGSLAGAALTQTARLTRLRFPLRWVLARSLTGSPSSINVISPSIPDGLVGSANGRIAFAGGVIEKPFTSPSNLLLDLVAGAISLVENRVDHGNISAGCRVSCVLQGGDHGL